MIWIKSQRILALEGVGRGAASLWPGSEGAELRQFLIDFKNSVEDKKKRASLAIKIGGALINGTAFVGGSYHAKYLIGEQNSVNNFPISTSRVFNNNKVK